MKQIKINLAPVKFKMSVDTSIEEMCCALNDINENFLNSVFEQIKYDVAAKLIQQKIEKSFDLKISVDLEIVTK